MCYAGANWPGGAPRATRSFSASCGAAAGTRRSRARAGACHAAHAAVPTAACAACAPRVGAGRRLVGGGAARNERGQQRSPEQAVEPPGQARHDLAILIDLSRRLGLPTPHESPAEVMDEIARVTPSWRGISYAKLRRDGPVPPRLAATGAAGTTATSAMDRSSGTWAYGIAPVMITASRNPRASTCPDSLARVWPSPTSTSLAVGT